MAEKPSGGFSATFIKKQFTEFLTRCGDISLIRGDQSGSSNGGMKEGGWVRGKEHVHFLQSECLLLADNQVKDEVKDIQDGDGIGTSEACWKKEPGIDLLTLTCSM